MTTNSVQLRLVLDVRFDLNGTTVDELKRNMCLVAEQASNRGLLTYESSAEVEEHSYSVMETPEPLEPGAISDFILEQIESGSLKLEDIPERMAEYGLMETPDFVAQMHLAMNPPIENVTQLVKRMFTTFVGEDVVAVTKRLAQGTPAPVSGVIAHFEQVANDPKFEEQMRANGALSQATTVSPEFKDKTVREVQALYAAATAHEPDYATQFRLFLAQHDSTIFGLYTDYALPTNGKHVSLENLFMDAVSDLKGQFGSVAANNCSDDEAEQEAAISEAEAWVADFVSPGVEECIGAVLWVMGSIEGAEEIRRRLA